MLLPFVCLAGRQPHDHEQSHLLPSAAGTLCRLKHCFYVDTQAEGMWKHVQDKHNMAQGKSATGKK